MMQGIGVTAGLAIIRHDEDGFASPMHRHEEGQLLYATSGIVSVTTQEGTWVVPPSRAVWLPPETEHETSSHGRVAFRSLLIAPEGAAQWPDRCKVVEVTPLLRELILKLSEVAGRDDQPETAELVARLLMTEVSFLPVQPLDLPRARHPGLSRLCDQACARPAHDIPIERAAATLAMSRASFMRLFRREMGMSFGQWRQRARLLHALSLLAEGRSVLVVALECGYESPSAFGAAFRRSLGRPPATYFKAANSVS